MGEVALVHRPHRPSYDESPDAAKVKSSAKGRLGKRLGDIPGSPGSPSDLGGHRVTAGRYISGASRSVSGWRSDRPTGVARSRPSQAYPGPVPRGRKAGILVAGPRTNTLTFRSNLAYAYREAGDLDRAIPLYEQTLADCERVLGSDHPITIRVQGNLATVRG
ncbi:hypothetical protein Aple_086490 [Acrocarpospora pleiomorpha]|uniref:Tetratricopeptide repeat protein n=1 Tax=Acrocarpospora pleiomorpha TaxID=90975 RepID=A0A5M3XXR5_9ACTN|nr:hypothetical protein Aple_086490 [Acrocarpospora pleiomorpha]